MTVICHRVSGPRPIAPVPPPTIRSNRRICARAGRSAPQPGPAARSDIHGRIGGRLRGPTIVRVQRLVMMTFIFRPCPNPVQLSSIRQCAKSNATVARRQRPDRMQSHYRNREKSTSAAIVFFTASQRPPETAIQIPALCVLTCVNALSNSSKLLPAKTLATQDTGFSSRRQGFESPWGRIGTLRAMFLSVHFYAR